MKNLLFNDRWLKVISILVALIIWLYIVVFIDPIIEISVRDVPIQFIGSETLEQSGLCIVSESETVINLKVKGKRKRMGTNAMKNIIARADVSGISQEGVHNIPIEVAIPFANSGISSQSIYSVNVTTEALVEKKLKIEVNTTGSLATNYMAGTISVKPESLNIKGPESVVGKITMAGVILNYAESDVDMDVKLPIRLYGTDGKEIAAVDKMLERITMDKTEAEVKCRVLKLKEIPIDVVFDYPVGEEEISYSINPEKVMIYSEDVITTDITSIKTKPVSIDKLKESEKIKAELDIPYGVKILLDISEVEINLDKK